MTDLSPPPSAPLQEASALSQLLPCAPITGRTALLDAIEQQSRRPPVRIGEALLALGLVDEHALGDALQQQTQDRTRPLGELLVQRGLLSRAGLQLALAQRMGFPVVDAHAFPAEPEAARRLPEALARRLNALPLLLHDDQLVVALEDPSARIVVDELETAADCTVLPVLATAGALGPALDRLYLKTGPTRTDNDIRGGLGAPETSLSVHAATATLASLATSEAHSAPAPLPSAEHVHHHVEAWLRTAHATGATAVHVECPPAPWPLRLQQRVGGHLQSTGHLPAEWREPLIKHMKKLAGLDVAEQRRPQSARVDLPGLATGGSALRVQVTTLPTADGSEDLVVRLSTPPRAQPLGSLGLPPAVLALFVSALDNSGLVLCAGRRGSGLSTLLHAALAHLNRPDHRVWTVESMLEVRQHGLRQLQLNARIDQAAAKAVRALQDADADVVMVDAPDDPEALREACALAQTGPLVLLAVRASDIAEAWTRLHACGVDRRLLQQVCRGTLVLAEGRAASFVAAMPQDPDISVI